MLMRALRRCDGAAEPGRVEVRDRGPSLRCQKCSELGKEKFELCCMQHSDSAVE
jgi:hypothetical protein